MSIEQDMERAVKAKALLEDPLVVEAFATLERDILEAFYACPIRDDEGRRILQTDLRVARQFKGILQGAIERGKLAAHELRERESFASRALKAIRS